MKVSRLLTAALCAELPAGEVPEWVELIPVGPEIVGQDGRRWLNDRPDAIVRAWQARRYPIPTVIDYEHATQRRAEAGLPAPAAGWVTTLENRGNAIWGRVEWTPEAAEQVRQRQYRFLSPAFRFEKATGRIVEIESAGLTNTPNFLIALNQVQETLESMTIPIDVLTALGLAEGATAEQAVAAVSRLQSDLATATNRAEAPPLDRFVPRPQYDVALQRAIAAEAKLAEATQAQTQKAIDDAIAAALAAGKITPATKDYFVAQCRQEGGLAAFQTFIEAAPAIVSAVPTATGPLAAASGGDLLKAECARQWAGDAQLRAEFQTEERYLAYRRAYDAGRVSLKGSTA
jgi:phage I-like protein